MAALIQAVPKVPDVPGTSRERLTRLALAGVSSPKTYRAYSAAIDEFLTWASCQAVPQLGKALFQEYKSMLIEKNLAPATINQRLASVAASIARVPGVSSQGVCLGHWLDQQRAAELLTAPPNDTLRGRRDRAVLALLYGAGLRRSEVADVIVEQIRLIEERWVIADLMGKGRRTRSVPIPMRAKEAIDRWCDMAGITAGRLFRKIDKSGRVHDGGLGPQTIYDIVRQYADAVDPAVRPHDLRRSFARNAYENHADMKQMSITLGHSSVSTTERYVAAKQNFRFAPCDLVMADVSKPPQDAESKRNDLRALSEPEGEA